jgi:hypothetical protein
MWGLWKDRKPEDGEPGRLERGAQASQAGLGLAAAARPVIPLRGLYLGRLGAAAERSARLNGRPE